LKADKQALLFLKKKRQKNFAPRARAAGAAFALTHPLTPSAALATSLRGREAAAAIQESRPPPSTNPPSKPKTSRKFTTRLKQQDCHEPEQSPPPITQQIRSFLFRFFKKEALSFS
jgi:hypothetical protein